MGSSMCLRLLARIAAWLEASVFHDAHSHLELTCQTPLNVVVGGILALGVFLGVASLLINLNKFSLHAAYRIRIVRTFLGASRASSRQPNAFTGFDPLDNVQMHELQPGLLREADIIYLLRIQHERQRKTMFPSLNEYTSLFGLNRARLADCKPDALIMHPGPINRGVEIDSEIADSSRSVILEQVTNGLAVRMAVLFLVNGGKGPQELAN